jgi:hypothetical protein
MVNSFNITHNKRKNCKCNTCKDARAKKCQNSNKCLEMCKAIMNTLKSKWNPNAPRQDNGLNLDDTMLQENDRLEEEGKPIVFNPDARIKGPLENGYRAFGKSKKRLNWPGYRQKDGLAPTMQATVIIAGTCIGQEIDDIKNGGGAWYVKEDIWNMSIRVSGDKAEGADCAILATIAKVARENL